jgi:cyclic pyranopterin phosphate synthase
MPDGDAGHAEEPLSAAEFVEIARQAAALGVRKVRLTGGEPLVRRDILEICRDIARIDGIDTLGLTTNGSRISGLAGGLRAAGVSRVNISSTVCGRTATAGSPAAETFRTRSGLDAALAAGF